MSFWKSLEHDLEVVAQAAITAEPVAAAIVGTFNPGAALAMKGISGLVGSLVTSAEQATSEAKQGALKSQTVIQGFDSGIQIAQNIYRQVTGKSDAVMVYDPAKLQAAIDSQVNNFNLLADLVSSVKVQ